MKDITGGYWGLVIVLSTLIIQVLAFGIALSIGVYNIEFLTLTDNAFSVSLVSAINTGVFLGAGPLASLLMSRYSHRSVVLLGAALTSSSMLCMPFLPSIEYMYVIFGIVTGLGFCFVFVPSGVLTGLYFDRHQSLATGVATSGTGLGMTVFPILVAYLIEVYSWKPSFLILAGLSLNLFVFALLLRPLPKTPAKQCREDDSIVNSQENHATKSHNVLKQFFVFSDFKFDIFFLSNILWNMGVNSFIMFGPEYLTTLGYSKQSAAFMLTIFGFCTFLGSLLTGSVGNLRFVNRVYLYQLVCVILGVAGVLLPAVSAYSAIVTVHASLGLGYGGILGLVVVLVDDLLGHESLGDGVGYIMLANGMGCFAGPALTGVLKNKLGNYDFAFYTAGAIIVASGVVMVAIPMKQRIQTYKVHLNSNSVTPIQGGSLQTCVPTCRWVWSAEIGDRKNTSQQQQQQQQTTH